MKIRREDLVAAAALGLLQRRQIGPLLLFLLQRDIYAKRLALAAQAREAQRHGVCRVLLSLAGGLAVATTVLFAVLLMTGNPAGSAALFFFAALYSLSAACIVARYRKSRPGRIRMFPAMILASVPLALILARQVAA